MASVTKRKWTAPDGTAKEAWMVRYLDPATGKRPGKTFDMKKDADAYRRKVEREIEDGTHVSASLALTVKEVCARYVTAAEARQRRGEIGATRLIEIRIFVDKHIVPNIGHKNFRDLTPADVDGFYDTLTDTLSAFYARQILSNLGTMERWAARQGFLKTSPVTNALTGIKSAAVPRIEEFTLEQATMILGHVLTRPNRRKRYGAVVACFVHLAACCGLRMGEISALDRDSIDLDRKVIRVRRNRTCLGEIKGPKSKAGNRDVPIPDHLCEMLARWMGTYYLENEHSLVFTTYHATAIGPTNIRYGWHEVLKQCGLYRPGAIFHFHALRHFAGSWWLENGMPVQDVSLQLGHSNASTTLSVYAHTISKVADRQVAMTQMGRLLLNAPAT